MNAIIGIILGQIQRGVSTFMLLKAKCYVTQIRIHQYIYTSTNEEFNTGTAKQSEEYS